MNVMKAMKAQIKKMDLAAASNRMNIIQIVLTIAAMVIGVALSTWIIKGIHKSVLAVKTASERAAEGDLNTDAVITSRDEIGEMAKSFNTMIANVRRVVEQINGSTATLASSSEELSATSEDLSKGAKILGAPNNIDAFDHPYWDWVRNKVSQKATEIRQQGFSGAAMLPYGELEYGGIVDKMGMLDKNFKVRK
jgi:nitrogen fixation/metabolism regulation signal transduction histidine kinase